jgi:hypothetical protein
LVGAADNLRSAGSASVWALVRSLREQIVERVRAVMDDDRYEEKHREGGELGPPRLLAIARSVLQ